MTQTRFLAVGFKLFALWLFLAAFQSVGVVIAVQKTMDIPPSQLWALLPAIFFALAGSVVWTMALPMAKGLLPPESTTDTVHFSPRMTLRIGCALLGLWQLTLAIPALGRIIAIGVVSAQHAYADNGASSGVAFVFCAAQVVVASTLLKANDAIATFVLGPREQSHGG